MEVKIFSHVELTHDTRVKTVNEFTEGVMKIRLKTVFISMKHAC
jgi:hypothetical protein